MAGEPTAETQVASLAELIAQLGRQLSDPDNPEAAGFATQNPAIAQQLIALNTGPESLELVPNQTLSDITSTQPQRMEQDLTSPPKSGTPEALEAARINKMNIGEKLAEAQRKVAELQKMYGTATGQVGKEWVLNKVNPVLEKASTAWGKMKAFGKKDYERTVQDVQKGVGAVKTGAVKLGKFAANDIMQTGRDIKAVGAAAVGGVKKATFWGVVAAATAAILGYKVGKKAVDLTNEHIVKPIDAWDQKATKAVKEYAKEKWEGVKEGANTVKDKVAGAYHTTIDTADKVLEWGAEKAVNAADRALEGTANLVEKGAKMAKSAKDGIVNAAGTLKDKAVGTFKTNVARVSSFCGRVKEFGRGLMHSGLSQVSTSFGEAQGWTNRQAQKFEKPQADIGGGI